MSPSGQVEQAVEEQETPRRRRLKLLLQLGNLVVLVVLLLLYLVYAVQTEQQPVAGWVAETPLESFSRSLAPLLWERKEAFQQQVRERPLSPAEKQQAANIAQRMQVIRPTHAVVLKDQRRLLGKLSAGDGSYVMTEFDGETFVVHEFQESDIAWRNPIVFPEWELTPRDYRFLFQFEDYQAYLVPPYLIVSRTGFAQVQQLTFTLSTLAEEYVRLFGSVCHQTELERTVHVALFPDRQTFLRETQASSEAHLVNSTGFFNKNGNSLYLYEQATAYGHLSGAAAMSGGPDYPLQVIRHEGAHQLAVRLGVLPREREIPFWLEEGMPSYCESSPAGQPLSDHLEVLRQASASGTLRDWQELLMVGSSERKQMAEPALCYAQAWLLMHYLMEPPRRTRFYSFLLHWQSSPPAEPTQHVQRLLNFLEIPASNLQSQLEAHLEQLLEEST